MQQAIGIDIGGTAIKSVRLGTDGVIRGRAHAATARTPADVLAQIDAMIAALDDSAVKAIGIGVPARVDANNGEIFRGGYVDLSGPPLSTRLTTLRDRPVYAANDGTMALIGEVRSGAARGARDVVMLTLGTGIGGAAMLGGVVLHGKAAAGQLGHITVLHGGQPCACGRRGCLETESSGTALGRHIAEAGLPATTRAEDLVACEDAISRAVVARWIGPLRSGIDSLVAVLDAEIVVLGGGLGRVAYTALEDFPAPSDWFRAQVRPAELGSDAGTIGAALAALERLPGAARWA